MKNYLLSIFRNLLPNISCCKSATKVGLGLKVSAMVRAMVRVRAKG